MTTNRMSCPVWPVRTSVLKTILIFSAYLIVGWSDSLFGPLYSQYQVALNSTTADTSYLVQASFLGFTLGNLILLAQSTWWSIEAAFLSSVLVMAVANLTIPHIRSLDLMCGLFFANGLAGGTIQAGSISRILVLWGNESAAFLQILDFCYAIGSIIGPFISAPFLLEVQNQGNDTTIPLTPDDLMIIYPYTIIGSFGGLAFFFSLLMFAVSRQDDPHPSRTQAPTGSMPHQAVSSPSSPDTTSYGSIPSPETGDQEKKEATGSREEADGRAEEVVWKKGCVILLASLTYAFTNGIGMIEQNFLTKYVTIGPFHLTLVTGASMTASSWIIHTICGILFVFLIKKLGIATNLLIGAVLIFLSANLLTFSSLFFPTAVSLWLVVAGIAIGGTTFFSCLVAFMESKFPVTPRMTSLYLITNCVCNVIWPALVGQFIEKDPFVFVLVIYICSAVSLLAVIGLVFLVKSWFEERRPSEQKSE